jgi:hypothetical protein
MADPIFFPACLSQADARELTNFLPSVGISGRGDIAAFAVAYGAAADSTRRTILGDESKYRALKDLSAVEKPFLEVDDQSPQLTITA